MKKIIFLAMLLTVSAASFSQQTNPSPALTKQDYLQKSKSQKTIAWVLLTGGSAMIVVGAIVRANEINKAAENDPLGGFITAYTSASGVWIAATGLVAAAGSIPLFIASGRNKRKAMSMSFKNETVPQVQEGSFVNSSVPSLSLKISL